MTQIDPPVSVPPTPADYKIEPFERKPWFGRTKYLWRLRHKNGEILDPKQPIDHRAERDQTIARLSAATGIVIKRNPNDERL